MQIRFDLKLDLLRQLFNASNLPFGTPEDLTVFAERLDVPGTFADDVRALLAAVICTERPTLTRMELLDLLCLAVGGTTADGSGTVLQPALWQILIFINGVLLSSRKATLPETVQMPARSAEEAPQISHFEQDAYVLERFDPPSGLPAVVSGRGTLEDDQKGVQQATLRETVQMPARSAGEVLQIDSFDQDAYALERFDLPSDLPWVVSGRDKLNDLEAIHSPDTDMFKGTDNCDGTHRPKSIEKGLPARTNLAVDVRTEPVQAATAVKASGTTSGSGGHSVHFETVLLDEKPALTAMEARGSTSIVSPVATDRSRRGALLTWPVSLACAIAGFLLGTLVPRYDKPCGAAPASHGGSRANTPATSAAVPGLSGASAQRSKALSAPSTKANAHATEPGARGRWKAGRLTEKKKEAIPVANEMIVEEGVH